MFPKRLVLGLSVSFALALGTICSTAHAQQCQTLTEKLIGATVYGSDKKPWGVVQEVILDNQFQIAAYMVNFKDLPGGHKPARIERERVAFQKFDAQEAQVMLTLNENELQKRLAGW